MRRDEIPWAWTYAEEPPAPPLRHIFAGGPDGSAARQFHIADRVFGLGKVTLDLAFRPLPPAATAFLGGRVVSPLARRFYGEAPFVTRMKAIAARLRPDLADPAAQEAFIRVWFLETGRTMTVYGRLGAHAARTSVAGMEHMEAVRASGRSVVVVTVHVGPWELVSWFTTRHFKHQGSGAWSPQSNRFENRLVADMRRRYDIKALPPSPQLASRLFRILKVPGQFLVMVIDEPAEKTIKFPLFGRPVPERCGFSFALRTAQKADAWILPVTIRRDGGTRTSYRYHPAFEVPRGADGIAAAAARLDALYTPHVIDNLEQWYMLHRVRL